MQRNTFNHDSHLCRIKTYIIQRLGVESVQDKMKVHSIDKQTASCCENIFLDLESQTTPSRDAPPSVIVHNKN